MNKICIIILYFGKLPEYFPLWLKSVKKNSSVDFMLFTDVDISTNVLPNNLKVVPFSIDSFVKFAEEKFAFKIAYQHHYKLCDFKPAFGDVLDSFIRGYEYWGNCDVDLMFGNLDNFITKDILEGFKKILTRGHLTIYRNEPKTNTLYKRSNIIDFKKIFQSPEYCMFDEWHGIHKIFNEFKIEQYQKEFIADINPNKAKFTCKNIKNHKHQLFVWEDGNVRQYFVEDAKLKYKDLAYIHFQKRRMPINDVEVFESKRIILNPFGFHSLHGDVTLI